MKYGDEGITAYEAVQAVMLSSRKEWTPIQIMNLFECSHAMLEREVPNEQARYAIHVARAERGDKASEAIVEKGADLHEAFRAKVLILMDFLKSSGKLSPPLEKWRESALQVCAYDAGQCDRH